MEDSFQYSSLNTQFHADTATDGIILHFSDDAAPEEDETSTKGENFVDPAGKRYSIEL